MDDRRRRPVLRWELIEAGNDAVETAARQQRSQLGNGEGVAHLAVDEDASELEWGTAFGGRRQLHRGQLARLVGVQAHAGEVAAERLEQRRHAGEREGNREPEDVVPVASAAQHAGGVDSCREKPGDEIAGDEHVDELLPNSAVEHRRQRLDVRDASVGGDAEPGGAFIQALTASTQNVPSTPAATIGISV